MRGAGNPVANIIAQRKERNDVDCVMASFAITYFFVKAIKDIGERK